MIMSDELKHTTYTDTLARIHALIDGETDWISVMCTIACELHHSFSYFDWTGFYRHALPSHLKVGPYQGPHGCLDIPFTRGVCGAAARTRTTQLVPDVHAFAGHIACSSLTQSEIVLPILTRDGEVIAVLDVDSNTPAAFNEVDQHYLEGLCEELGERFGDSPQR